MKYLLAILSIVLIFSCSKKEVLPTKDGDPIDHWGKFIGNYNVYDTLGLYQYDLSIQYSTTIEGNFDSLTIFNFADTFDVSFQHITQPQSKHISIGFHDSIVDYNGKSWGLWGKSDNLSTPIPENTLFNDTIVFYYDIDNIKYYIQEAQPYYQCHCKIVAVKQ